MQNGSRSQYWCFTLNNYTDVDISLLVQQFEAGTFTYLVFGEETGESGTRHLQGYLEFPQRRRFNQVRDLLPRYHLEARRGSAVEASDYCKKDGSYVELGTISRPNQGRRTDLAAVAESIRDGATIREIAIAHPESFIKYHRGITVLRNLLIPRHESTEHTELRYNLDIDWTKTQIFIGPTGCGKTTYALQLLPKALFCTHMDDLGRYDEQIYDGIIFDEACFLHLPRESQIHICDQDQDRSLHVRYMCARIPKRTKKIFTSNKPLCEILLVDPAIVRRIQVHEL